MLMMRLLALFACRPVSRLHYVFGMAKSQAVSWAHFHMARTSRVKPMSLGFSRPRISRCFMMAMNSLLLSSPFPKEDRQEGKEAMEWWRGRKWEDLLVISICERGALFGKGLGRAAMNPPASYRRSRTGRTPRRTRGPTAPPWQRCGPPASW